MAAARLKQAIVVLGIGCAAAGLLLFAYLGTSNRFFADDWCYNRDFKRLGLVETLTGYNDITTYASNRFSLTLFTGLLYPFGIPGVMAMTGAGIAIWLAGIFWILKSLNDRLRLTSSSSVLAMAAGLILYFFVYLAPHPYQNLHWRAGFLPYTAPLILAALLFGLYLHQFVTGKAPPWQAALAFTTAFFTGGFSEAASALLVTATAIAVGAALLARKLGRELPAGLVRTSAAGFAGAALAMLVLILSPAIPQRMVSYGEVTALSALPGLVFTLGIGFVRSFFTGLLLPSLAILLTAGGTAMLFFSGTDRLGGRRYAAVLFGIIGISFLLISASHAPSAYIEQMPPEARGLLPARTVMIGALWAIGTLTGVFIRPVLGPGLSLFLAAAAVTAGFGYTARSITIVAERLPIYAERAEIWDERDALIRAGIEQGLTRIEVRGIDSLPVSGMLDLKPKPTHWVNVCAARYYGVDQLLAVLPEP